MLEPQTLSKTETLVALLRECASSHPDRKVFTFLVDGEMKEVQITYQQLDEQVRAIAAQLQLEGVAGEPILLLYPPGLEYIAAFFGCLYAGAVAVPSYPPHRRRADPRLEAIIANSQAKVALTNQHIWSTLERRLAQYPTLSKLRWLKTDDIELQAASSWQAPEQHRDDPAFLQYTSGSTAQPKGVVLTHHNLLSNLTAIRQRFQTSAMTRGVFWLPPYHDMGLIGGILGAIACGGHSILMTPLAFLQKPVRWLQAISRYQATVSGAPNFAYELCLSQITPEQRATLNLSSWQVAFNGAEPIRADTLARFSQTFAPNGFRHEAFLPCYGLAEATLLVAGNLHSTPPLIKAFQTTGLEKNQAVELRAESQEGQPLVSCGPVIVDHNLMTVDPESMQPCAPGQIGEIWVAGDSVAQSYWHDADATRQTFQAYLADGSTGPFLRTGDLGFINEGELFITGRLKDLIIVRGLNHYPQDLELVSEQSHTGLRPGCGAAFSVEQQGEERAVIVFEIKREARHGGSEKIEKIIGAIRSAVTQSHQLELYAVVLIKPGSLPKTSSGKVQRQACRTQFLEGTLSVIKESVRQINASPPSDSPTSEPTPATDSVASQLEGVSQEQLMTELQLKLAEFLNIEPEQIDLTQPIHTLGLGSLGAVGIKTHLEDEYGVDIPAEAFFREVSLAELVAEILADPTLTIELPQSLPSNGQSSVTSTISNGQPQPEVKIPLPQPPPKKDAMQLSLFFFAGHDEPETKTDKYQFLIEAAKFADSHDFDAVWLPERHFHAFGGLYPNPVVLAAALARETQHVRLRAGSVVLPLHHPIRIAEEWAMVDNLSQGRVDLSFAAGWNADDFVLAPENFEGRSAITLDGIELVRKLWQGETVSLPNGLGQPTEIQIHPLPHQADLSVWLTCSGTAERFIEAGARGYNVLTALLFQPIEALAENIAHYRATRAQHGHDPATGHVTLMLHTFVGPEMAQVRNIVEQPLIDYLKSSKDLWSRAIKGLPNRSEQEEQQILNYALERYIQTSALIGTPVTCTAMVNHLHAAGVDEIACLIDFGVEPATVLDGLQWLSSLRGG